jgi:hypothetical protein
MLFSSLSNYLQNSGENPEISLAEINRPVIIEIYNIN